jgi:hypothetical protein
MKDALTFAVLAALAVIGCTSPDEPTLDGPETLQLVALGDSIEVGSKARVVVVRPDGTLALDDAAGDWTSSSTAVAVVSSSGIVEARSAGVTTIRLTRGGESGSARIFVRPQLPAKKTYVYGFIKGRIPGGEPVTYSCGPGLFGGSTVSDAQGSFQFAIRFPDSLKADLLGDYQIGCSVRYRRLGANDGALLGVLDFNHALALPFLKMRFEENLAPTVDVTDMFQGTLTSYTRRSLQDTLFQMPVGGSIGWPIAGGSTSTRNYFEATFPVVATASGSTIQGAGKGTAPVLIKVRDGLGTVLGTVGVVGARVHSY